MASRNSIKDAAGKQEKAILGIEREIVIMKLVDHPNVMCLYDVWETSKELWVILFILFPSHAFLIYHP